MMYGGRDQDGKAQAGPPILKRLPLKRDNTKPPTIEV